MEILKINKGILVDSSKELEVKEIVLQISYLDY